MSVMKLGSEQYLYLALSHKIDNYTTEEKYNIFRNLNVLGLCERYDDLFIDSWQPSEEREKFKNVFEKFSKKENPMTKIYNWDKERNTLQNLVDDFGLKNENTNLRSLLYNSFSLCNEYQKLYIIDNKDRYELLKDYKNLRSDEKDFIENYEYIVNNKDKYSKTMQISNLKEEIVKGYEERQRRWKELFGEDKEDEKHREEYIKYLSKEVAKECILKGIANDYRFITSHLTYETINQFLCGAYEKAEQAANDILNSDKQVDSNLSYEEYIKSKKEQKSMENENKEVKKAAKWVTIPEECVTKPFMATYANGQDHSCVLIKLPNNQMFRMLESQVKQHLTLKELRTIPINDYGINLVESKGNDDIAEFDENEQSNSIKHLDGNEAYDYLTKEVFSQLNNENTKFLKIPSNLVTDMPLEKDDERKPFVSIKLPSYMQERDGFKFANAQFYANKAFHVIDDKHDLRAIPCYDKVLSGENAGKDVFFKVSNYNKEIEVKATDLFNYNKEDYSKFLNNQKKTDNSNGIKDENNGKVPKTEEKSNTNTNTKKSENSMS